jgi:hypothetical protein
MAAGLHENPGAHYVETRLLDQERYFDRRAKQSKRSNELLAMGALLAAGSVPLTVAIGWPEWFIAAAGTASTFLIGLQALFKHHENWLRYRTAAEDLRRERALWETGVGPYAGRAPAEVIETLVERTEALIAGERESWVRQQRTAREQLVAQAAAQDAASST